MRGVRRGIERVVMALDGVGEICLVCRTRNFYRGVSSSHLILPGISWAFGIILMCYCFERFVSVTLHPVFEEFIYPENAVSLCVSY